MTTAKTIALTRWTFVGKVMSLLFNMLSRLVISFLPRSKRLLISWLQSLSAVMLELKKIKKTIKTKKNTVENPMNRKTFYFWLIDYAKAFDCVGHKKLAERDGNTRPHDLPLEKPVCRSGSNS